MALDFSLDDVPEDLRDLLSPIPTADEIAYIKIYMENMNGDEEDFFRPWIEASPLFQVYSVTVHGPNAQTSEIYGTIYVTNEQGESFVIYCMGKDKPQVVVPNHPPNNFLLLSGPDAAIQPGLGVTIKVDLKDRARNDVIVAQGDIALEYVKKVHGEQHDLMFEGRDQYYVKMHYGVLPYGIIATVQVSFFLNDDKAVDKDNQPTTVDVYGMLTACCRSNIGDDDFPFITLFDRPHDQPLKLCSGTEFKLSRSVVALPAYAALQIQANLNIPIAEDTIVFGEKTADACVGDTKDLPWENGFIRVKVEWYDAYTQPFQGTKLKEAAQILPSTEGEESEIEEQVEVVQSSTPSYTKEKKMERFTAEYGEVFSVVVCSKSYKSLKVHGKIVFDEGVSTIDIFNKDISNPDICSIACRLKSVVGDSESIQCINGFYIRLDLKHENHLIAKGSICHRPDEMYEPIRWVDRRLCAVFRGDIGYAIVHYSIFSDSVQARMSVSVEPVDPSNTCCPTVCGQIFASYSKHTYSSRYDKDFYRCVLFDQDQPTSCSGELWLVKKELPVPPNSNLIIEAELVVSGEELKKSVEFKYKDLSVGEIQGSKYNVKVRVSRWTRWS